MYDGSAAPADDALRDAASLTFAVIRFAEGAAHSHRGSTARGHATLGRGCVRFRPVVAPRASRGRAGVPRRTAVRGDALSHDHPGRRGPPAAQRAVGRSGCGGSQGVREPAWWPGGARGQLGLTADSPILLEFGDEAHVVSLAVLLLWSERFAVHVGWNIGRLEGDPRASARLNLFRSDGVKSRGWS